MILLRLNTINHSSKSLSCHAVPSWKYLGVSIPVSFELNTAVTVVLQGAFYVLADMSEFFGPAVQARGFGPIPDADALCMYLIQQAHVALVPGDAFGAPTCIRISYAASMDTLREALDRLEKSLQPDVFTKGQPRV